ncbi:GNAT family N-acetyltransferase [Paenibacillus sp. FSL M7-1046]|uniref:GNAT family N-acetyltransferase n=1 Tax=Paenibacillus sp. FSL M7-1046 TaxID=2975315 RepID=UPI0030F66DEA
MTARFRAYTPEDMLKVRQFISHVYSKLGRPNSWLIARFEFEIFFLQKSAGWLPEWEQNIGLWEEEDGKLVAVACKDGDFYFQLDTEQPQESLLMEMFEFIEEKSRQGTAGYCKLAIPAFMPQLEKMALSRGYELLPNESDNFVSIALDRIFPVEIPSGFTLCSGADVSNRAKAQGHIMAFNYPGTPYAEQMLQYYGGIAEAPGYRPELDLSLVNGQGEVVSFCNAFLDEENKMGILEPVGTHRDYRLHGLGRTIIYEALNRLRAMGMVKAYTGPMQPFYEHIGFELDVELTVWKKEI